MKPRLQRFLTIVALLSTPALAYGARHVPLTADGQASIHITLDRDSDGDNRQAAQELARFLQRMSGAEIPMKESDGRIPLHLGEPAEFAGLPFEAPKLAKEAFLIKVTPKAIWLLGGSPLGTRHAVYTVLRDLGCRWVMPGSIGECIPEKRELSLPVQERTEAPAFRYRQIWYAYGSSPEAAKRRAEWARRNRMHTPLVSHGHNLTSTLAPLAPFEKRPELYSLYQGKRAKRQVCTSNPETVRLIAESIRQNLDKNPNREAWSLCPDDNTDFCECDKCRALDVGHTDRGGSPSVSDRYQVFLNQVAERLAKTHPNLLLSTYSYNRNHTDPPQKTKVHPNTAVFTTSSAFCSAHGIGDAFCESRQQMKTLLSEWTARTRHVFIYEYDPVPYSGGLPWPMWSAHVRSMPVYKELGIQGFSFEGQNSWAAYFPNYYIAAQLMWDTGQDGKRLFEDMLAVFFREAAPHMADYYQALESRLRAFDRKAEWGLSQYPDLFPPEVVESCRTALGRAESTATTPMVKKRLEMVRLSFDEMDAYLAIRTPTRNQTFAQYKASIGKMNRAIDRMSEINEDYLLANIARKYTRKDVGERFAPQLGFLNRWHLIGPFDNAGMAGHDKPYPPERTIDLSARYDGKDGMKVSWKPNKTPDWQAYIDLTREFDLTDWVCAYAVCRVTLADGPRKAAVRVGSNDSVKVFLNGKVILSRNVERVAAVDDDVVPITLPAGSSTVLLKIGQSGLNWGFYFRITEPDSTEPLTGLTASAIPPP